jgi:hypothetical protein
VEEKKKHEKKGEIQRKRQKRREKGTGCPDFGNWVPFYFFFCQFHV